ncbi:hypothetical protein NMY22_g18163 [Coprinellus aureogranulatus]|nr:hypothetical protein NMY22_g18163 [Coprinellus aureogranulatus]
MYMVRVLSLVLPSSPLHGLGIRTRSHKILFGSRSELPSPSSLSLPFVGLALARRFAYKRIGRISSLGRSWMILTATEGPIQSPIDVSTEILLFSAEIVNCKGISRRRSALGGAWNTAMQLYPTYARCQAIQAGPQHAGARSMGNQTELHEKLQEGDLAKGGSIPSGKKGTRWKTFQSYTGEDPPLDELRGKRYFPPFDVAYCEC